MKLQEEVRFSNLKNMSRSPAHYRYSVEQQREDTLALRLGRLTDAIIFETPGVVIWDGIRRGKAWDAFKATNINADIFTLSEFEPAKEMALAIQRHDLAMQLLDGDRQHTLRWDYVGRKCRGTPDCFTSKRIVDLKTARNAHPDKFRRDAIWYGYHAQLAWYLNGIESTLGKRPEEAFIVAVESAAPYPITIHQLTPRALDMGERMCRLWMERLLVCEASGSWPGYCEAVVPFDVIDDSFELQIDGETVEVE